MFPGGDPPRRVAGNGPAFKHGGMIGSPEFEIWIRTLTKRWQSMDTTAGVDDTENPRPRSMDDSDDWTGTEIGMVAYPVTKFVRATFTDIGELQPTPVPDLED